MVRQMRDEVDGADNESSLGFVDMRAGGSSGAGGGHASTQVSNRLDSSTNVGSEAT